MSCQHSCKFPNGNVRALQHQPLWCLYFSGVNLTLCSRSCQQKPWSPVSWNNINTASAGKYSGHFVSSLCHTHTHQMYLKDNGNLHLLVGGERLYLCIWKVQLCSSHLLDSHSYSWEQSTKFAHTIYIYNIYIYISAILDWTDLEDS